jgi:TolB-like protein
LPDSVQDRLLRLWSRCRERRLPQHGLAYAAAAWVLLQVLGFAADAFGWPAPVKQVSMVALASGFPLALALAWFLGGGASQRIGAVGAVVLVVLVAAGIGTTAQMARNASVARSVDDAGTAGSPLRPPMPRRSIAVLPFESLGGVPGDEYFAEGLAEELLNRLARVEGLNVASRTAVERLRPERMGLDQLAEQLHVAHVLEGSVRRGSDRLRVSVRLVAAENGYQLWSQDYDAQQSDVIELQVNIANSIAEALQVELPRKDSTSDPLALDKLLRARHLLRRRSADSLLEARALAERAVGLDPEYADAWSTLATVMAVLPDFTSLSRREADAVSLPAARRALELDPLLAEPFAVLAAHSEWQLNWRDAERNYRRALELDPDASNARFWYANMLDRVGYTGEAQLELRRFLELEPANSAGRIWLALQHLQRGDHVGSLAALDEAERLGHTHYLPLLRGMALFGIGDDAGAVREWTLHWSRQGVQTKAPQLVVDALRDPRRKLPAVTVLRSLPPEEFGYYAFVMLGEVEDALRVFESSDRRVTIIDNYVWWRESAPLRRSADFGHFAARLKLPEFWRSRGPPDLCQELADGLSGCE